AAPGWGQTRLTEAAVQSMRALDRRMLSCHPEKTVVSRLLCHNTGLNHRIPIGGLAVSLIDLDHLSRHYGRRRGIERVSLSVREGDLFGFLGPNGAGKTTTIRVMLGFLRPSAGAAKIFGLDCWEGSRVIKRQVGYLPGDLRLPAWMNGSSALSIFGAV